MTQLESIKSILTSLSPKAVCDDCLAQKLGFSQRQRANQLTRKLAISNGFDRYKDICSLCTGNKIVTKKGKTSNVKTRIIKQNPVFANDPLPQTQSDFSALESLLDIGFKHIGMWSLIGDTLKLNLYEMEKSSPALYAFVNNNGILYVGKTSQFLAKRLYFYAKPGISQSTNIRVNAHLIQLLSDGTSVNIYGYSPVLDKQIGAFTLNLPAGLEDDIIRRTSPIWNSRK